MDTRVKKSLLAPYVLATVVAAALTLTGGYVLFELQAPLYLVNGAPFAYRLEHILSAVGAGWRSSFCGVSLANWLNFDCRLQVFAHLWADGQIKTRVLAVGAAALVGATTAFFVSAGFCSRRERFATLTSERPVYDREARASLRAAIAAFGDVARGALDAAGRAVVPDRRSYEHPDGRCSGIGEDAIFAWPAGTNSAFESAHSHSRRQG